MVRLPLGMAVPVVAVPVVAVAALLLTPGAVKPAVAAADRPLASAAVTCASKSHPALAAAMARDIGAARRSRSSAVALWVDAPRAGLTCSLNGSEHFDSASTVKVTILAALLRKALDQHRYLTGREASLARAMITMSDNNAASALWAELGHAPWRPSPAPCITT